VGRCVQIRMQVSQAACVRLAAVLYALALLPACGGRDDDEPAAGRVAAAQADGLPAPEGVSGSVTGMPTGPGPGTVPLPGDLSPDTPLSSSDGAEPLTAEDLHDAGIVPIETRGEQALAEPPTPDEPPEPRHPARHLPASGSAVGVVRDYYAAINARSYERAHALWADGGRSSGQSAAQFADSFSQGGTMSVGVGGPGAVDTATGVPYVEVPVDVTTTYQDGTQRHFRGIHTLRADNGGWRIVAADIREVGAD
jgi:hypothetical protein